MQGMVQIGILKHDKRIATAQFQRRRFKVMSGPRRNFGTRCCRSGQRHALDAPIVDDRVRLIVRDRQVGIKARRGPGLGPQRLECHSALRHVAGVFDHQNVARHQMRTGHAGQLVIRKVPRLHRENYPDRAAFHMRLALGRMQGNRSQEAFGVLGVVGEDRRAESHFSARISNTLAHFLRHRPRQTLLLFQHQSGDFCHDLGPLRIGLVPPRCETRRRSGHFRFKLRIGHLGKGFQQIAGCGVDALIRHDFGLLRQPRPPEQAVTLRVLLLQTRVKAGHYRSGPERNVNAEILRSARSRLPCREDGSCQRPTSMQRGANRTLCVNDDGCAHFAPARRCRVKAKTAEAILARMLGDRTVPQGKTQHATIRKHILRSFRSDCLVAENLLSEPSASLVFMPSDRRALLTTALAASAGTFFVAYKVHSSPRRPPRTP